MHRLADPGRLEQHQMMTSRCTDLGGTSRDWLTDQVRQVPGDRLPVRLRSHFAHVSCECAAEIAARFEYPHDRINRRAPVPYPRGESCQARRRYHPQLRDQGSLGGILLANPDRGESCGSRSRRSGQNARDGPDPAVQAKLADQDQPFEGGRLERARRGQNGQSDTKIEPAAALGPAGRRQSDRDPASRPGLAVFTIADLILSRASRSAVSGSPTRSSATMPFSMSASISTGCPCTPTSAIACALASPITPPRAGARS
jgi:hypothetical protein